MEPTLEQVELMHAGIFSKFRHSINQFDLGGKHCPNILEGPLPLDSRTFPAREWSEVKNREIFSVAKFSCSTVDPRIIEHLTNYMTQFANWT